MSKEYDYNVYCDGQEFTLSAYQLMLENGDVYCDTENYITLYLPINKTTVPVIAYLTQTHPDIVPSEDWEDYDEWPTVEYLTHPDAPSEIRRFIMQLPEYETRIINYGYK